MSVASALPDAVATVARAVGVLNAAGDLDSRFFDHPLDSVGGMLSRPQQRRAFVDALSILLGDPVDETLDTGVRRRYPLAVKGAAELSLAVDLVPAAAGPDVTVLVAVRAVLRDDPDARLSVDLDLPIVRAAGTTVEAVCGKQDGGPVRLRFAFTMPDGLTVTATAAAHDGGGWLAARIAGVVIDGTPIAPVEVRSDRLADGALQLFHRLLEAAAALLGDDADTAGRVLRHLPGVLGLDDPAHLLPVAGLLDGTARWRDWFADLAGAPTNGADLPLRAWVGSVGALLGVEVNGSLPTPTPDDPWTLHLHEGTPDLALTVALATDGAGHRHLVVGLRAAIVAPDPADARLQAEFTVVDLPLAGAAAETWFDAGRVVVVAPHSSDRRLVPPGPVGGVTPAFAVGRLISGIRWRAGEVAPALDLHDVIVDGRPYPYLDLTDADTLSNTVSAALEQRLRDLLGPGTAARALLVLTGIEATAGRRVEGALLATAPTRAIAEHHRALLVADVWHRPGGPFRALAGLLGVADSVELAGTGTGDDPWRLPLTGDDVRLLLTASGSGKVLTVGLRLEASAVVAALDLLTVGLGPSGETRVLDRVCITAPLDAVDAEPVTVGGGDVRIGWSVAEGFTARAAVHGLALTVPDADGRPVTLDFGDLRLLPWAFDPAAPDLGLGIDPAVLPDITRWVTGRFGADLRPMPGTLVAMLAETVVDLLGEPPRLDRLTTDPAAVARAVMRVAAAQAAAGPLVTALPDIARVAGAGFGGAGTPTRPWTWSPDPAAPTAGLTAWLAPAGPVVDAPLDAGTGRVDIDDVTVLARAAASALGSATDPWLAALATGRPALADGLVELAGFCSAGDGLLPGAVTAAPAGWDALTATAPYTGPFADPAAVTAAADDLDAWGTGPLVLLAPAWWPATAWQQLVVELTRRHPTRTWGEIDLRRDPLGALATVTVADAYVVLAGDGEVPAVLDRIAVVCGWAACRIVVVDPDARVLAWLVQRRDVLDGVLAIGLRAAADADPGRWTALSEPVRVVEPLLADDPVWGPLVAVWREVVDGQTAPDEGRPAQAGLLRPSALTVPPVLPDLTGLNRRVLVAAANGEDLMRALARAVQRRAAQHVAATAVVTGVTAPVALPAPTGPVRASVRVRLDLCTYDLRSADDTAPTRMTVEATLERVDGWLVGPPAEGRLAAVRRIAVTVSTALDGRGDARIQFDLQDTVLRGLRQTRCTPGDAGFTALLAAVLDALPNGDPHVDEALRLAADHLGVVAVSDGGWSVDTAGIDRLLGDPTGTLAARARARAGTETGLLGLNPDPTAPAGVRRLVGRPTPSLHVVLEPDAARLRVHTVGEGVPFGAGTALGFDMTTDLTDGARTASWHVLLNGHRFDRMPDPAELTQKVPAVLLSAVASVLLSAGTGGSVGPTVTLPWITDPLGTLSGWLCGGAIGAAVVEVARELGFPVADDGTVTLVPGILDLRTTDDGDDVRIHASTPVAGWTVAPGLVLGMAAGLRFDASGVAAPSGSIGLTVDLEQAVGASGWDEVGIDVSYDGAGPRVAVRGGGATIGLVPRFSGFDTVIGAAATRFLPTILDSLVAELADTPLKQRALGVAAALEVYGPTFAAAAVPLRQLGLDRIRARAAELAVALADLAAEVVPVAVTAVPGGVRVAFDPVAGGTLTLTVAVTGELAVTVALDGVVLGAITTGIAVTAVSAPAGLQVSGAVGAELDLHDALRVSPGPKLTVEVAADGTVTAALLPLPDRPRSEAVVELLPVPRVQISAGVRDLMAQRWLVAPALDVLTRLLADLGLLDDTVMTDGPTWRRLLSDAGLVESDQVRIPLDPRLLPNAALAFANEVSVPVTDELIIRVVRDGPDQDQRSGVGLGLTGVVPVSVGGDIAPAVVLGDAGGNGRPPTGGLVIFALRGGGTSWTIEPQVRFDRVGVRVTGPLGRDLLTAGPLALGGIEGRLDLTAALAVGGGGIVLSDLGGELWATGIALPGSREGEGGNPVAASLLAPTAQAGDKVNPRLDLGLRYSAEGLRLLIGGLEPGETLWIPVNQTFGPLHIAQIGIRSDTGAFFVGNPPTAQDVPYLGVRIDGGVTLGPLALAVKGLGIDMPVQYVDRPGSWRLNLDGLAVAFDGAGVTLAGGLEKGLSAGIVEYRGFLQVRAFGFGASAIGAYTTIDGQPSFYAFAAISAPLGGPPYLFITGLAGGLGFNRTLRSPDTPEQVPGFPLVAIMREGGAVEPDALLQRMGEAIQPAERSYWFAAGIKFTTFEILKTIALGYLTLTPSGVEIGLLGLMSAAVPSETDRIASLELGLIARYSSSDQTLSVLAQLTRNSWLFTENCRLTGGFAFMVWFGKPQVVLTVGGYGPLYVAPDYFPQVPELGFRWQVTEDIVIKGGSYYAVTPEVMTVGGRLEASAVFPGGHANVCMYAHAALWFWPPRFVLNAGFRVTGKIGPFGFDVGCDVRIELPPLWGRVTIYFMGEHRFYFGSRTPAAQFLETIADFVRDFLGGGEAVHKLDVPVGIVVPGTRPDATTTGGGQPAGTADDPWPVAPEFTIATTTALPAVTATLNGQAVPGLPGGIARLYALPVDKDLARLDPEHRVEIVRTDDGSAVPAARLSVTATSIGVPTGIYGVSGAGSFEPPAQDSAPTEGKAALDTGIGGLRITAGTQITSSAGAGVVVVADLVEETPPAVLPLDVGQAQDVAPTVVAELSAAPAPQPPRLRWSTRTADPPGAMADRSGTMGATPLREAETQLWDLPHDRPSTRLIPDGPLGRVVVFDPMGRVLDDAPATETVLPTYAASLMIGAPVRDGAGWQAGIRVLPATRWVFVAPGAIVEIPMIGWWPTQLRPGSGVPVERLLTADVNAVATRFAAATPVETVVVTLDARTSDAALTDLAVAVTGGVLGAPFGTSDRHAGRLTLVYPVTERVADWPLTVSVVVDPRAWVIAGTVALAGTAQDWWPRLRADPWARLVDVGGADRRSARAAAAASFLLEYEVTS